MAKEVYKFGRNITWSIPVLFQYEIVWGAIFHHFKESFIELPRVNGYGSPRCLWTGGRPPVVRNELDKATLFRIFTYLEHIKLTPSFTFTCTQLTEDDLNDRYSNYLLDMALDVGAHFIVYDDRLKNHIREKKSDAYVVSSVIKPAVRFQGASKIEMPTVENETEMYNKLLKEYDMVVVRPEYSSTVLLEHPEYIDDISRIEVLINQPCVRECPRVADHYRHMEGYRLDINEKVPRFECIRRSMKADAILENTLCHDDETVMKLVEHGVRHLKLQGRGSSMASIVLAAVLYGQMFRQDGPNNLHLMGILDDMVDREMRFFQESILQLPSQKPKS